MELHKEYIKPIISVNFFDAFCMEFTVMWMFFTQPADLRVACPSKVFAILEKGLMQGPDNKREKV